MGTRPVRALAGELDDPRLDDHPALAEGGIPVARFQQCGGRPAAPCPASCEATTALRPAASPVDRRTNLAGIAFAGLRAARPDFAELRPELVILNASLPDISSKIRHLHVKPSWHRRQPPGKTMCRQRFNRLLEAVPLSCLPRPAPPDAPPSAMANAPAPSAARRPCRAARRDRRFARLSEHRHE